VKGETGDRREVRVDRAITLDLW